MLIVDTNIHFLDDDSGLLKLAIRILYFYTRQVRFDCNHKLTYQSCFLANCHLMHWCEYQMDMWINPLTHTALMPWVFDGRCYIFTVTVEKLGMTEPVKLWTLYGGNVPTKTLLNCAGIG